MKLTKVEDWI